MMLLAFASRALGGGRKCISISDGNNAQRYLCGNVGFTSNGERRCEFTVSGDPLTSGNKRINLRYGVHHTNGYEQYGEWSLNAGEVVTLFGSKDCNQRMVDESSLGF